MVSALQQAISSAFNVSVGSSVLRRLYDLNERMVNYRCSSVRAPALKARSASYPSEIVSAGRAIRGNRNISICRVFGGEVV